MLSSVVAGGITGALTWGLIYPLDMIKTRIQTMPLNTPLSELSVARVASDIIKTQGTRALFRGMGVTLLRAFPVNGTIFPVYEWTLAHMSSSN
jgi:hypothetical protein